MSAHRRTRSKVIVKGKCVKVSISLVRKWGFVQRHESMVTPYLPA